MLVLTLLCLLCEIKAVWVSFVLLHIPSKPLIHLGPKGVNLSHRIKWELWIGDVAEEGGACDFALAGCVAELDR